MGYRDPLQHKVHFGPKSAFEEMPVPVENQIRTYSWCNPPRIGRQRIRPALFTVRVLVRAFIKNFTLSLTIGWFISRTEFSLGI
jgi:hypothetical protein